MWRIFVIALCVGCSKRVDLEKSARASYAALGEAVDAAVKDPDRAARTKASLEKAEATIDEYYRSVAQIRADMFEVSKDYDATEAQFNAVLGRLHLLRTKMRERLIGHSLEARKSVNKQEWAEITGELLEEVE